jgi:hypothetical protein
LPDKQAHLVRLGSHGLGEVVAENTAEQADRMIAEAGGVGCMSGEAVGIDCTLADAIVEVAGHLLAVEVALTVGHR